MNEKDKFNHNLATAAWGVMFIWWGIVILIDPITIGVGAIGTGSIMLGVNLLRTLRGIPAKGDNTVIGLSIIVWGAIDHFFALPFWPSLAVLLSILGLVILFTPLLLRPDLKAEDRPGDV